MLATSAACLMVFGTSVLSAQPVPWYAQQPSNWQGNAPYVPNPSFLLRGAAPNWVPDGVGGIWSGCIHANEGYSEGAPLSIGGALWQCKEGKWVVKELENADKSSNAN